MMNYNKYKLPLTKYVVVVFKVRSGLWCNVSNVSKALNHSTKTEWFDVKLITFY